MSLEILVTGGDAAFFPFLTAALASLRARAPGAFPQIGVIDQGLLPAQRTELSALGCRIVQPEWTLPVPEAKRHPRNIGLVARTALRDYFPGYRFYFWLDADAWIQTPAFMPQFLEGARRTGAAVALEQGPGYRRPWGDLRWWCGNMLAAYGVITGLRLSCVPSINIGVLCLRDTAPHWEAWVRAYTTALRETGKVNLDQHAFLAAVQIERLKTAFLPARNDWLPHLSRPVWDSKRHLLCEPRPPFHPLSVVHLAGPDKARCYRLPTLDGGVLESPLTYPAMQRYLSDTHVGDGSPCASI